MNKDEIAVGAKKIILVQGDIVTAPVEAIVNAANSRLAGGGGVDGAIHRAAGPELLAAGQQWVRQNGPLPAGQAVLTSGFQLDKFVIHTVGPVWKGGGQHEALTLASCYRRCLELATEQGLKSLAFSAISCGVYGYPHEQAAEIALRTVYSLIPRTSLTDVFFYLFSREMYELWGRIAHTTGK